jgi:hypothetical protein
VEVARFFFDGGFNTMTEPDFLPRFLYRFAFWLLFCERRKDRLQKDMATGGGDGSMAFAMNEIKGIFSGSASSAWAGHFQGRHKPQNGFIMRKFVIRSENDITNDIIFFE